MQKAVRTPDTRVIADAWTAALNRATPFLRTFPPPDAAPRLRRGCL